MLTHLGATGDRAALLAADVRAGLTATPKTLPPKWFYDAAGSELFELITLLPEYYQTRTETQILEAVAGPIVAQVRPAEVVELGSGSSRKTRLLLEAMLAVGSGDRYVPFDVSEDALRGAADDLTAAYPWLAVEGVVGDFDHHLAEVPRAGRRLVAFLGSTIGNLHPSEHVGFLRDVRAMLQPGDAFLLGLDLVKDTATMEAAYNDAAQVTAAFNRNVLHVLRRELDLQVDPEAWDHIARYREERAWIEMALAPRADVALHFPTLDLDVAVAAGEEIRTEISCKFTRAGVERIVVEAGMDMSRWDTDPDDRFALALVTPRP